MIPRNYSQRHTFIENMPRYVFKWYIPMQHVFHSVIWYQQCFMRYSWNIFIDCLDSEFWAAVYTDFKLKCFNYRKFTGKTPLSPKRLWIKIRRSSFPETVIYNELHAIITVLWQFGSMNIPSTTVECSAFTALTKWQAFNSSLGWEFACYEVIKRYRFPTVTFQTNYDFNWP